MAQEGDNPLNNNLFLSTKEEKHKHIAYFTRTEELNRLTGQTETVNEGLTSEAQGHRHDLVYNEELNEIVFMPAGKDNHIHEIEGEYIFEGTKLKKESDKKTVDRIKKMIDESFDLEKESFKNAKKSEEYYSGKQWSDSDKASLAQQGRPALTINECAPKVDLLSGFQRQARTDIRFFPIEASDNAVANVATELIKNIFQRNNFQMTESEVFKDEVVAGRGTFQTYVDYDKNLLGEVVTERVDWNSVNFGPFSRYDLSDCEYTNVTKTYPKVKLKMLYPDKSKEIDGLYETAERRQTNPNQNNPGMEYRENNYSKVVNLYSETITINEVWERNYLTVYSIVNVEDGFVLTVDKLSNKEVKNFETMGFQVIKRTTSNMQKVVVAGDLLLERTLEEQDFFPIVPVYCKKDTMNNFYGKVHEVIDVQDEINKRQSQSIDIVNKVASYGSYYDDQTFDSEKEASEWRRNYSKPGFTAKVRNLNKLPAQTQGVRMPTELVGLQAQASDKMREIMNISPEASGFSEREVSSVAIIEKRRNVLTANEFLFDNLAQSKKLLAKNMLKLVQSVYTVERIMRIIGNPNPQTEEEQLLNQQKEQSADYLINTQNLDELDISVDVSAESPTTRSANFSLLMEMVKFGMPIPPQVLIDSSDLPNKGEIMSIITGQQQQQAQEANAKNETEILKTQIANQDQQLPPQ